MHNKPDKEDMSVGKEAEQPDINEEEEDALDSVWSDMQSDDEETTDEAE